MLTYTSTYYTSDRTRCHRRSFIIV